MEDEDDLAIKEYVLYQLETCDLVGIVNNLFCAYVNKIKFENIRQQREQVIENLRMSGNFIEAFMSTMDNFDVLLMPEEEYKKREQQYNSVMEYINLFEEDEEVQQALYRRITELDYDEDSVESRAYTTQIIWELLYMDSLLLKVEENTNKSIQNVIAENLEVMTNLDLLMIYEWIPR